MTVPKNILDIADRFPNISLGEASQLNQFLSDDKNFENDPVMVKISLALFKARVWQLIYDLNTLSGIRNR